MALCFTNELAWRANLAKLPAVLHDRFCDSVEELAINLGLRAVAANSFSIEIDLAGASPANFFKWINDADIAAVSIGPQDIAPLMGRNLDSLVLKRAIERGEVSFEKLLPEEIMPRLREAAWSLIGTSEEPPVGLDLELAKDDLIRAGFMTEKQFPDLWEDPLALGDKYQSQHATHKSGTALPTELTENTPTEFDPFL
jgi:hypothetical protein